jgi:hypothetical protein
LLQIVGPNIRRVGGQGQRKSISKFGAYFYFEKLPKVRKKTSGKNSPNYEKLTYIVGVMSQNIIK